LSSDNNYLPQAGYFCIGVTLLLKVAVYCSSNTLVSITAVALHWTWLVLGWVTAFWQVNFLIV